MFLKKKGMASVLFAFMTKALEFYLINLYGEAE